MSEPRHLLDFEGDPNLQFCYRALVTSNDENGIKSGFGSCDACRAALTVRDHPRLKPPQRLTKTIQKLMVKSSKKVPLNRFESFKLQKFLKSSQQMADGKRSKVVFHNRRCEGEVIFVRFTKIVKCSHCEYVNKKLVKERKELVKLKETFILEVEEVEKEVVVEEPIVEAPKKRKRKKKKKKKETRTNPNSLISDEEEEKEVNSTPVVTPRPSLLTSTPASSTGKKNSLSLREFMRSDTKETSSSAILQKTLNPKTLSQKPVSSRPHGITNNSTKSSMQSKKKSSIHKQLKLFLSENSTEGSPKLQDFLTML